MQQTIVYIKNETTHSIRVAPAFAAGVYKALLDKGYNVVLPKMVEVKAA